MSAVPFVRRHVGPSPEDIEEMASAVGAQSLDDLIDQTVPESIRLRTPLNLPAARSEEAALRDLREMMERNELRTSLLGMGYTNCHTPAVIRRNILENPAGTRPTRHIRRRSRRGEWRRFSTFRRWFAT